MKFTVYAFDEICAAKTYEADSYKEALKLAVNELDTSTCRQCPEASGNVYMMVTDDTGIEVYNESYQAELQAQIKRLKAEVEALKARLQREDDHGALTLIAAERRRQIEQEGWTPEHDDEHDSGQLASAASVYAATLRDCGSGVPVGWPWGHGWWKPTPDNRVRELVKAGALIVAEIERIQRLDADTGEE